MFVMLLRPSKPPFTQIRSLVGTDDHPLLSLARTSPFLEPISSLGHVRDIFEEIQELIMFQADTLTGHRGACVEDLQHSKSAEALLEVHYSRPDDIQVSFPSFFFLILVSLARLMIV